MKKILFFILLAAFLTGCASGSAIITGTTRPVTDPKTVKLYLQEPSRYEVIGIVESSCETGWTAQVTQDRAVEEIKRQAAKLGANGVLLGGAGEKTSTVFGSSGAGIFWAAPVTAKTISGKAIYVYEE